MILPQDTRFQNFQACYRNGYGDCATHLSENSFEHLAIHSCQLCALYIVLYGCCSCFQMYSCLCAVCLFNMVACYSSISNWWVIYLLIPGFSIHVIFQFLQVGKTFAKKTWSITEIPPQSIIVLPRWKKQDKFLVVGYKRIA